jgi:hypothetical protein
VAVLVIIFTPTGTGRTLYTEAIDLACIGRLLVARATTIEFDNQTQYWRVKDRTGFPLFNSPSRQECLDWERQHLQSQEDLRHELQHRLGAPAPCARTRRAEDRFAG